MGHKKIAVIGCGKVGLPYAVRLSELGCQVNVFDINPAIMEKLLRRENPFEHEPGLSMDLINAKETLAEAIDKVDVIFSIVPTPEEGDHLSGKFVEQSLDDITPLLTKPTIVVVVSTLDPRDAATIMHQRMNMRLVYSPPLIRLGSVKEDLQKAKILFLGSDDREAQDYLEQLWYPRDLEFYKKSNVSVIRGDITTIAMAKMAINYSLSVKVGLANDIAAKCRALEADPDIVLKAVGSDPRIGKGYMTEGNSPAGPCLPRDAMVFSSLSGGSNDMSKAIIDWHHETHIRLLDKAFKWLKTYSPTKIGILGITYNPGGLDLTNAIGFSIANQLAVAGFQVSVFDPATRYLIKQENVKFNIKNSIKEVENSSEVIVIGCMWDVIRQWFQEQAHCPVLNMDWRW